MTIELILQYLILLILIVLSGFFSGSETAFFSLNHLEKDKLKSRSKGKIKNFVNNILNNPDEFLITILTGNMFVNFLFASILDNLFETYIFVNAWLYSIIAGTMLILIFGEMTPKNIAIRHSLAFNNFAFPLLRVMHLVIKPVRVVLRRIEQSITTRISRRLKKEEDIHVLIRSALQMGLKKGILHHSELTTIESFFQFREKNAEDVMLPRTEINGISVDLSIDEIKSNDFKKNKTNIIPVFKKNMDYIIGYIKIDDILPFKYGLHSGNKISQIIKPILPVPETKNLLELMKEMINSKKEMAVIVDEYGGTAGIVTFSHLVKNFLDFFYPENDYIRKIKDKYILTGQMEIEKLSEIFNVDFNSESRTLGGLIIENMEEIPIPGKKIKINNIVFTVRKVVKNRISEVEARKTK
jgi:CBS domain containing-hemolysin-like protein